MIPVVTQGGNAYSSSAHKSYPRRYLPPGKLDYIGALKNLTIRLQAYVPSWRGGKRPIDDYEH